MKILFASALDDGQPVTVEYERHGPDAASGLPDGYGKLLSAEDENGKQVKLTEVEEKRFREEASEHIHDIEILGTMIAPTESHTRYSLWQADNRAVLPTLADDSLPACVTDPPYDVNLNPKLEWDVWPGPGVWKELARVLGPQGLLAFSIAPHIAHHRLPDAEAAGFRVLEVGFWVYGTGRPVTSHRLRRNYDLVYFMSQENRKLFVDEARLKFRAGVITGNSRRSCTPKRQNLGRQFHESKPRGSYFYDNEYHPSNVACLDDCEAFGDSGYPLIFAVKRLLPINRTHLNHPTQKPPDLLAQIIRLVSREGDVVLDPFAGSGSTGEVALQLGRKFWGIESRADYYTMMAENLEAVANQTMLPATPPLPSPSEDQSAFPPGGET